MARGRRRRLRRDRDLVLAAVATESASYVALVLPCLLIGAGFVVATTVRTAIIFASLPDGLPASAAALNESSISLGRRIGIVLVSAIVAQVAMATYSASLAGLPPTDSAAAIAAFRTVLVAVGTPSFAQVATTVASSDIRPYLDAYAAGLNAAFLLCGLVGVVGGAVALLAFGRADPLVFRTRWEFQGERGSAGAS